jgi:hypothetical protein
MMELFVREDRPVEVVDEGMRHHAAHLFSPFT